MTRTEHPIYTRSVVTPVTKMYVGIFPFCRWAELTQFREDGRNVKRARIPTRGSWVSLVLAVALQKHSRGLSRENSSPETHSQNSFCVFNVTVVCYGHQGCDAKTLEGDRARHETHKEGCQRMEHFLQVYSSNQNLAKLYSSHPGHHSVFLSDSVSLKIMISRPPSAITECWSGAESYAFPF